MWTDDERQIAANFIKNPEIMAFLKKVYCPDRTSIRTELERNVALPDEQYGQLMKAVHMAEVHFANAHANLSRIAAKEKEVSSPIAPR